MGGRWPYSCCFEECCFQDLFITACSIHVQLPSSSFFLRFVSIQVVHSYSSMDTTAASKKLRFILPDRSDLHMTDSLSIVVHVFGRRVLMSFSVDEMLLPRYVNLSTSFWDPPFRVEIFLFWFWSKHMYSVLSALTWRSMPPAAFSRLCSRDSIWADVFSRSPMSSASTASVIVRAE